MKFTEQIKQVFSNWALPKKREPEDMFLVSAEGRTIAKYRLCGYATQCVKWVSLQTDKNGSPLREREPSETNAVYSRESPFRVAGKDYPNFESFLKSKDGDWGEDLYGRKVLCAAEGFPCFDSFDFIYENRCYRWYIIRNGNSISRVFVTDEQDEVCVTDDVRYIEHHVWKLMQKTGFCQPPEGEG